MAVPVFTPPRRPPALHSGSTVWFTRHVETLCGEPGVGHELRSSGRRRLGCQLTQELLSFDQKLPSHRRRCAPLLLEIPGEAVKGAPHALQSLLAPVAHRPWLVEAFEQFGIGDTRDRDLLKH